MQEDRMKDGRSQLTKRREMQFLQRKLTDD